MISGPNGDKPPTMEIGGYFIGIAGSADREIAPEYYDLAEMVGKEIMARGHRLVSGGCSGGITQYCAESAASWLGENKKDKEIKYRIISIVPEKKKFAFINLGQFLICKDLDRVGRRPMMASIMDVLITISGGGGTKSEGENCFKVGTPVVPITGTGGASQKLYSEIEKNYSENLIYKQILSTPAWEKLGKSTLSPDVLAKEAVDLAEKMADLKSKVDRGVSSCLFPNKVFVIMPFKDELNPVWEAIQRVFESTHYKIPPNLKCTRADEKLTGKVVKSILDQIYAAPFVIADLTGNNPNVLFETGYSEGIGQGALLINQSPGDSVIDVANRIQIKYDLEDLGTLEKKLVDGINQLCGTSKENIQH
jgi:uncharacterized protein (TIGR00725 family)